MTDLSNSLADLAERIREATAAAALAQRTTIEKAFEAGLMLCHAKETCAHGEWMPFLDRAGVHERQARRLMQIASSGLQIGHVSEIGGIKATLEYIGKLKLPDPGDILFISPAVPDDENLVCAWVQHSKDHPGFFDLTSIKSSDEVLSLDKPVAGKTVRCSDGHFFNGLWTTLEMMIAIPQEDREFVTMPAEILEKVNDCPFLETMAEPDSLDAIDVSNAPLPDSYQRVAEAVHLCEQQFSKENVDRLQRLMSICLHRSEKWPTCTKMIGTYARISAENRMSDRIGRLEAIAKLKWGKLAGVGAP